MSGNPTRNRIAASGAFLSPPCPVFVDRFALPRGPNFAKIRARGGGGLFVMGDRDLSPPRGTTFRGSRCETRQSGDTGRGVGGGGDGGLCWGAGGAASGWPCRGTPEATFAGGRRRAFPGSLGQIRSLSGAARRVEAARSAYLRRACRVLPAQDHHGGTAAGRKLVRAYRRRRLTASFSLSKESCFGPETLAVRSGCFFRR